MQTDAWRNLKAARLQGEDALDVEVYSTFILYLKDGVRQIVFHHEREDFWQLLRTRGVLPLQG